jgi:hypothetical protein
MDLSGSDYTCMVKEEGSVKGGRDGNSFARLTYRYLPCIAPVQNILATCTAFKWTELNQLQDLGFQLQWL